MRPTLEKRNLLLLFWFVWAPLWSEFSMLNFNDLKPCELAFGFLLVLGWILLLKFGKLTFRIWSIWYEEALGFSYWKLEKQFVRVPRGSQSLYPERYNNPSPLLSLTTINLLCYSETWATATKTCTGGQGEKETGCYSCFGVPRFWSRRWWIWQGVRLCKQ